MVSFKGNWLLHFDKYNSKYNGREVLIKKKYQKVINNILQLPFPC
jgi:hypothetical protein